MSLSAPTEYGPANPPRFPIELIRPTATAPGRPLTRLLVSAQSPEIKVVSPAAASKFYGDADPPLTGTLTGFVAADSIVATYDGPAVEIGFNAEYLLNFLRVVTTDEVTFLFKDSHSAGELRPGGDKAENYRYVIMPMRI